MTKIITLKLNLFNQFELLYNPLLALLNDIKAQAPMGPSSGPAAYGNDYAKAKSLIQATVSGLTLEQVSYVSGLNFTKPTDDASNRADILNSVISAYDAAAAKYMKNQPSAGNALLPALAARLQQFDVAVQTEGKTPVLPDA